MNQKVRNFGVMDFTLTIRFAPSPSRAMPEILRACRNFDDFHDNTLVIHSITELWSRWSDFSVIIWGVVKLSGTLVYVNDVPILPLNNNLFYLLQDVRHCHESRGTDPQYCREGWGCRRLRSVTRYIGEQFYSAPMWYRYGKFTAPGVWLVDRDQIARQLSEEAALSMSVYCPFYDAGRVYDAVMALPKVIRVDDNWMIDYRLDYRQDGAIWSRSTYCTGSRMKNTANCRSGESRKKKRPQGIPRTLINCWMIFWLSGSGRVNPICLLFQSPLLWYSLLDTQHFL